MLVDHLRYNSTQRQEKSKKTDKSGAKGFKLNGTNNAASENNQVTETTHVSQINPFLAIQEFDVLQENKERLQQHGKSLLKHLQNIRLALLNDEMYLKDILQLKEYLASANLEFEFPEYKALITEIQIRVEVEIAKFEMK